MSKRFNISTIGTAVLVILAMIVQGCSKSTFVNGSSLKHSLIGGKSDKTDASVGGETVIPGSTLDNIPVPGELKDKIEGLAEADFKAASLVKDFMKSVQNTFYIITTAGNVYQFNLQGANAASIDDVQIANKKSWTFPMAGIGGARTYVTEGGLVFVRSGGRVYWIDPLKTAEGALDMTVAGPNYYQIDGVGDFYRGCPVSYKIEDKRYIGVGYDMGKFSIFTQEPTPPYKPDWTTLDAQYSVSTQGEGGWGWSCFIDQKKLIYYGAWTSGGSLAFDIAAKKLRQAPGRLPRFCAQTVFRRLILEKLSSLIFNSRRPKSCNCLSVSAATMKSLPGCW